MQGPKTEKAIRILEQRGIGICCEWLLSYEGGGIADVPGVMITSKELFADEDKHIAFSYEGKVYELRYENLMDGCFPDGEFYAFGDFRLFQNNNEVLFTSYSQDHKDIVGAVDHIDLQSLKRAILGDWVDVIPKIVGAAKKIRETRAKKAAEDSARELDDNIDLGEYE